MLTYCLSAVVHWVFSFQICTAAIHTYEQEGHFLVSNQLAPSIMPMTARVSNACGSPPFCRIAAVVFFPQFLMDSWYLLARDPK